MIFRGANFETRGGRSRSTPSIPPRPTYASTLTALLPDRSSFPSPATPHAPVWRARSVYDMFVCINQRILFGLGDGTGNKKKAARPHTVRVAVARPPARVTAARTPSARVVPKQRAANFDDGITRPLFRPITGANPLCRTTLFRDAFTPANRQQRISH